MNVCGKPNINKFKNITTVLILIILAGAQACDKNLFFEVNKEIPDQQWSMNQEIQFLPNITDTNTVFNIFLNIRNTGNYPNSNLYLFVTTTAPSGQWIKDTVNIQLADQKGKWLGSGIGDIFFSRKLFKKNVRFPATGVYKFSIRQGMRMDELKGIRDVGLRIEKVEMKHK